MNQSWNNPWKLTALAMALVAITALVTGLVVANWGERDQARPVLAQKEPPTTAAPGGAIRPAATPPSAADIEACNQFAKAKRNERVKEVAKDALIGGAVGAGVGAAGGAIADGGSGAGKGAGIGGLVGIAAGTVYGLNETKKNDPEYVSAYRACMKRRGHTVG